MRRGRRPVVLFLDPDGWHCFLQLAAALRRAGARPVRVRVGGGWRQAVLGRVGYGTDLRAERRSDVRRLRRMVDGGRVIDVQVSELGLARLEPNTPCAAAIRRAGTLCAASAGDRWSMFDKLRVSERLRAGGVDVPPFARLDPGDRPTRDAAVTGLGYPLMVKQRLSTAGQGVLVASDEASLDSAISTLSAAAGVGSPSPPIFAERYFAGEIVQYAATVGLRGVEQEVCVHTRKAAGEPFGPSAGVVTIDDRELRDVGQRAVELLSCRGLVNLEFIRGLDGRLRHIDLSVRAFGNVAALADAGIDLIAGYLSVLGLQPRAGPGFLRRAAVGTRVEVFPPRLHESTTIEVLLAYARGARPYARRFGTRYVLATALVIGHGWREAASARRALRSRP